MFKLYLKKSYVITFNDTTYYPDLKASEHFIELQRELSIVEDTLQHARRFYNDAVRLLNTRIDSFPDLIMAGLFHYQYRQYFQMERD